MTFVKFSTFAGILSKIGEGRTKQNEGSNAEIVWRRAQTPDGVALYPCTLVAVSSQTHPKNVPVRPSSPELHRISPPPSATAEARCFEGHVCATGHLLGLSGQSIFRIKGLVCCTALTSARPIYTYQLCTCLCTLIFIFLHIIYISILATQSR